MKTGRLFDLGLCLSAGGALAVGAFAVPVVEPGARAEAFPTLCWFRSATGVECPFCGMTRSFASCLEGRVADGFAHHPMGPFLVAAAAAVVVVAAFRALRRSPSLWEARGFARSLAFAASACVVSGLVRTVLQRAGA